MTVWKMCVLSLEWTFCRQIIHRMIRLHLSVWLRWNHCANIVYQVDNVCSIMSGLGIKKNPLQELRVGTYIMYGWKIFGNWNVARSYWNARKSHIVSIKCKKTLGGRGSAPGPARVAYSAPPDPLAGWEGAGCPSSRTPPPLSAFRASPVLAP